MNARRVDRIRALLEAAFEPEMLTIEDDSHKHAGHEGAKSGMGHFSVSIVSARFNGMRMLARHRAVYAALDDMMQTDIHALAIDAVASDEL
ncbi:MAG: BolA family transcriptional regulator [Gammaproteobacteria bacterium]|nr:BolA family transcriptional regulator [Gammaproteobacteria bacterium]MBT8076538.1 BolA family transcriptional regulator [Gammaproteobacteria bacterium]NNK99364.1 BolA family transcriptional regulator [Xanthomonadales bacterium]